MKNLNNKLKDAYIKRGLVLFLYKPKESPLYRKTEKLIGSNVITHNLFKYCRNKIFLSSGKVFNLKTPIEGKLRK